MMLWKIDIRKVLRVKKGGVRYCLRLAELGGIV